MIQIGQSYVDELGSCMLQLVNQIIASSHFGIYLEMLEDVKRRIYCFEKIPGRQDIENIIIGDER